jgi:transcriptional regulator with XRE-family HTH domain
MFSELILDIRNEFGMTQEQFAEMMGVQRTQVTNVELDNSGAALHWITTICDELQIEIFYNHKNGWDFIYVK